MSENPECPSWITPLITIAGTALLTLLAASISLYNTVQINSGRISQLEDKIADLDKNGSKQVMVLEAELDAVKMSIVERTGRIDRMEDRMNNMHNFITAVMSPKPMGSDKLK